MVIDDEGILLPDGSHASNLYRLHPMELLIDETTATGEPLGEMFLDLYNEGRFNLFNPPEASFCKISHLCPWCMPYT